MAAFLDICRFNPAAGGTSDFAVSAAVTGYITPSTAGAVDGAKYKYRAESADLSQWEVGEGVYTAATSTLSRATVLFNSAGTTAKINFSAAPQVAVVALAEDLANQSGAAISHAIATSGAVATDSSANMPGIADTVPTSSEGSQLITVSITPKSASSTLVVEAWLYGAQSVSSVMQMAVFRDSGASALATEVYNGSALNGVPYPMRVKFSVASSSKAATTFKVRFGLDRTGTMTVNGSGGSRVGGGVFLSGIEVTEFGA